MAMQKVHVGWRTVTAYRWGVACPTNEIDWAQPDAQALLPTRWDDPEWRKRANEVGAAHYCANRGCYLYGEVDANYFEVYKEVPEEEQTKPLREVLRHWYGKAPAGTHLRLEACTLSHHPEASHELLLAKGLARTDEGSGVYVPLDAPAQHWERPMTGRWESTTHSWIKVMGDGWIAHIPTGGHTIRGKIGDTNMYSAPDSLYVGKTHCASYLRIPHREEVRFEKTTATA